MPTPGTYATLGSTPLEKERSRERNRLYTRTVRGRYAQVACHARNHADRPDIPMGYVHVRDTH